MIKKRLLSSICLFAILTSLAGCGQKTTGVSHDMQISNTSENVPTEQSNTYAINPSDSNRNSKTEATQSDYERYGTVAQSEEECDYNYDYGYSNNYDNAKRKEVIENGFTNSVDSPLSTFAADVDTASYSTFRQCVLNNVPLSASVYTDLRTEEMVNFFKYDYPKATGKDPFSVSAEISNCPWNSETKLMSIGVSTNEMDSQNIPDCNIVFLVDVSGSMHSSNKLPLVKQSMELLIDQFDKKDRISIVTYASGSQTILNGTHGNEHTEILRAFENLVAGGSTNGSGGIELAYEIAEENYIEDGVNRIIICSDGDFNVGLTSESELENMITEKKDRGIFLSTLGFGMNYSDVTMETLADCGNGNYGYIDNIIEAKRILLDEMSSTFVTVAKDVKFQVEFNPATVSEYRLVGYENRALENKDFVDDSKDGGEMGAGHQVTALYELKLTDDVKNASGKKYKSAKLTSKGADGSEYCTLSIAYKEPDGDRSEYLSFPVSVKNYTENPDDNFLLASSVAECSLALRNSEFLVSETTGEALRNVAGRVNDLCIENESVDEFKELLKILTSNSAYNDSDEYDYNYDYKYQIK